MNESKRTPLRPSDRPTHNSADHLCQCPGCSGSRDARGGISTPQWWNKPYGAVNQAKVRA